MNTTFYDNDAQFLSHTSRHNTQFVVSSEDTFSAAAHEHSPCCLSFASHQRPGGGYRAVCDSAMPINTQEEDLFRRSTLPQLMDVPDVRQHYPLHGVQGFYCSAIVLKDRQLNLVSPFRTGVVTIPAVVNPTTPEKQELVACRARRIFEIAADNHHQTLILGAWGCGVFNNDPGDIARLFREILITDFGGVFLRAVFAVPGESSSNYRIFKEVITS